MENPVIVSFLSAYELPAIFFGAFFFGESIILAATFLSAEGLWSPFVVFGLSFLGTIIADVIWFLLGRKIITFASRWEWVRQRYEKYLPQVKEEERHGQLWHFLFFKFMYGTRIITIVFVSVKNMRLRRFIFLDSIGTIVWLSAVMVVGWLTWKGAASALPVLHNLGYALIAVVFFVFLFRFIIQWASRNIFQNQK